MNGAIGRGSTCTARSWAGLGLAARATFCCPEPNVKQEVGLGGGKGGEERGENTPAGPGGG